MGRGRKCPKQERMEENKKETKKKKILKKEEKTRERMVRKEKGEEVKRMGRQIHRGTLFLPMTS